MNTGLLITGDNVHVFKYIDASPFEIVCATAMELIIEIELIGATTPESGTSTEVRQRLEKVFLNISGATTSTNDGDVSIFYMKEHRREAHDLEVVFTDNNGLQRSHRQDFFIERVVQNGNAGEASQYDINFRGTGDYVESELEDPDVIGEEVTSRTFTIAAGVVQHDDLKNVNVVEVCREGTELTSMSLAVPYTYNSATGTITPDPDTTIDGQKLFVIWTF